MNKPDANEYWMGVVMMLGAYGNESALIVNSRGIVSSGLDVFYVRNHNIVSNHKVHAEINALQRGEIPYGSVAYLSHTPCYTCVLAMLSANIQRVVYFETTPLDERSIDAFSLQSASAMKFSGNLNWMRDYMAEADIFVQHDKK